MSLKKNYFKPNTLMSIHGYKSFGKWQDKLSVTLSRFDIKSAPFKYGYKIWPGYINREVEKFKEWYFQIVNNREYDLDIEKPFHRPSIIAHSLGTWILAKALLKYPEIKFDKIYLLGSIIPAGYDWYNVLLKGQVSNVYYERAMKDWIVKLSFIFTSSVKPSARHGFLQTSRFLKEVLLQEFDHGDFDYDVHFSKYVYPRLKKPPHQLEVIDGENVELKELFKIFKQTYKIDKNVFNAEYTDDPITIEIGKSWAQVEPNIWSFVRHVYMDKILGYVNAIPVNESTYKAFITGQITEVKIKGSHILDYSSTKEYYLLILSVAIHKDKHIEAAGLSKYKILEMLILSIIYKMHRYKQQGIVLKKFAACAWSDDGERLCNGFNMVLLSGKSGSHSIYEMDFSKKDQIDTKQSNYMAKWMYNSLIN